MLCKPKSFYDEANKVAIGYKNPLYLSKAKRVQLALYSGQEIIKTNHDHVVVHDSKDTLEIVETTRKQMNEKMNDPMCVKKKAKALKEKAKSAKPITAMTVYPPNTPAKLRITPTGLTEGERGFEQTKTCYLTEVIPFFKTIKEHFEGIQTALIKEIKEMKEVFEQMKAEMDQHAVDKKCDEIERKNLLIENENLIADYLSKEVFYTATNYVLTVSRFSDMHDAHTAVQKCVAELEAKNSNLKNKIQNDDHDEMIKYSSKLEKMKKTNEPVIPSTGVKDVISTSGSKPRSNTKNDRTLPAKCDKKEVEVHPRKNKSSMKRKNRVDSSISYKHTFVKKPPVNKCPLTRFTKSKVVPVKQPESVSTSAIVITERLSNTSQKPLTRLFKTYDGGSLTDQEFHEKFIGTVRFGNDHFGAIMGYGDYVIGAVF
ncbi:hypothetical protein Tco_0300919 [Tanacetum coccineum]